MSESSKSKQWVRNRMTGDMGFVVYDEGVRMVQMDRGPNVKVLRPWPEGTTMWVEDVEPKRLIKAHVARVCWEADRALCDILRIGEPSPDMTWGGLRGPQRMLWEKEPPEPEGLRSDLWHAVRAALGPATAVE